MSYITKFAYSETMLALCKAEKNTLQSSTETLRQENEDLVITSNPQYT